jgi:hydroxymethylbilane synthase
MLDSPRLFPGWCSERKSPMSAPARVVIATRESPLALWQAEHVREILTDRYPGTRIELLGMTTRGDQILDRTLSKVGGKGLFVKELETALLGRRAHLAVHSLKDVPMQLAPEFTLAAVMKREDPRDCLVSNSYGSLEEMPAGARVGTSSLRRELMLRARFPALRIEAVRGNVNTRLAKLDRGDFDALVMAAAGMKRLGLAERIRQIIPTAVSLPAPGQGALGIEVLSGDSVTAGLLAPLDDAATRVATMAERGVSRGLGGSCQVPLAAYAEVEGDRLRLRALVGNAATGEYVETETSGGLAEADHLAAMAVAHLKERGALRLLGMA